MERRERHPHDGISDLFIRSEPLSEKVVLRRHETTGQAMSNVPHGVVHHSPTGYEWGYEGSGPADLALNIAEYAVAYLYPTASRTEVNTWDGIGCSIEAWIIHQDLKSELIGRVPNQGAEIPWSHVLGIAEALLQENRGRIEEHHETMRSMREADEEQGEYPVD